jgi:cytochrome b
MANQNKKMVNVWDILIRIFHWSLLFFVLVLFLTEDEFLGIHSYAGYTVLLLLGFRLVWGLIGTSYARFGDFLATPKGAVKYLKEELSGDAKHYLGHNPAGAVMIVGLISSLFLTGLTGMATIATEGKGPLADSFIASLSGEMLGNIHVFFTDVTLFLIILHVVGVVFSSFMQEENLVRAMITGKKKIENYE